MPCTAPIRGFRERDGTVRFDTAAARGAVAVNAVQIPCGKCMGCRVIRISEWTTRIMHELQTTSERGRGSSFITLTYDEAHLPSDWGLHVEEWQLFAKRLRKRFGPFKYFACGEYGEKRLRPHFHAIIFGLDFAEDRIPLTANANGDALYLSPSLERVWGRGQTRLGGVDPASASYVASYSLKKHREDHAIYERKKDQRAWRVRPEFACMSLRPAIGKEWFNKYRGDIFPSDETIIRGKRVRTPRYYDKLLETQDADALERIKTERKRRMNNKEKLTTDRLQDYEETHIINSRNRTREL